jgi:hypothetical protein
VSAASASSTVSERALERRLHLHRAKLCDGEAEVLLRLGLLIGVVRWQQLREPRVRERELRPEADAARDLKRLQVVRACLLRSAE